MTALAIETVLVQLAHAGLRLSLAPAGGLAVAPSSLLTAELCDLIRSSKAMLVDWLAAANDGASHAPDPPEAPADWKERAAAYHAHHFKCATCITAGRGSRYGQRCSAGMALWQAYCDCCEPHF